ncbi:MAG: response regulator transcription factor [Acidobacteria bacterium]|nr:response regulator transcription factor [Acidobacteriota bacterium]
MRAVLVDDEPLARQDLRRLLEAHPRVRVEAECADGFEAVRSVNELHPDLVFLDIQMPRLTGFDVVELLRGEPLEVVFVTAFDHYALEAFRVHALDYLLKPVAPERLAGALEAYQRRQGGSARRWEALRRPEPGFRDRLVVRDGGRVHVVPVREVRHVQAQDDYVLIRRGGTDLLRNQPLNDLEKELDPRQFVRVHRSHLLNVDRLVRLEPCTGDTWVAFLDDGTRVPVSRAGYRRLKDRGLR